MLKSLSSFRKAFFIFARGRGVFLGRGAPACSLGGEGTRPGGPWHGIPSEAGPGVFSKEEEEASYVSPHRKVRAAWPPRPQELTTEAVLGRLAPPGPP